MARALHLLAVAGAAGLLAAQPSGFVDPKLCAPCHRQIADDYARTGMGRSFYRPSASTLPDPPRDFYHDRSDTHYAVTFHDSAYYQRRWQIGLGGKETNVEEFRIDYVMGSGNHARSYLHRTARGTLIELPFGWYSEGRGHWGMSPGSDSDRPMTRRFISYKCMFCHNGVPQIPSGNEAPGSDPIYVGELPQGIDCQRCHGPGARHIQTVRNRNSRAADVRASIVNPARLDPARAMEICMQCHLETSSGRIPSTIVRFDRGPFSFVPGEPLDAFLLTFDHAPGTGHDDKFEAVSSVYRLRQSKCFTRGKLTCATCHNPHKAPRGAEAAAHYSAVCRQCHSAPSSAAHADAGDCAGCHMPKRRAEDTPGMVMTDHLIQRGPASRDLTAGFRERPPEEYRGEVVPYYPPAVDALYRAVAQVGLKNNFEAGLPVLAREIAARKPVEAEFYLILGDAWRAAGNEENAVAAHREAARRAPKSPRVLRAAGLYEQALATDAADPLTWFQYGMRDLTADKIAKAIDLDPTLPDQHRGLGEALLAAGKPEAALDALRAALRTDPSDDSAWDLAGRALAGKREWPEAFYHFEKAVRLRPGHATYLYDYALALARADRLVDARTRAEAAVALQPDSARFRLLLGNVLIALGDGAAAMPHLQQAARGSDAAISQQAGAALKRLLGIR